MPSHVYPPRNDPPSLLDRVLTHSSDVGLSALITVPVALQVLLAPLFRDYEPSRTLSSLSVALSVGLAVLLGAGGVLATVGLLWRGHVVSTGWALEQVGWLMVAGGWGGFTYMAVASNPETTIAWYLPMALCITAFTRCAVVFKIERAMRPVVEAAKTLRGEDPV